MSGTMASCSDDQDEPKEEQVGQYANRNFVGSWEGSDESDEFAIIFEADGSYKDYLIQNGVRKYEEIGKYSVSENTLIIPASSNLYSAWGEGPYTMYVSGNRMEISCSLMDSYGQKLVLTKK